MSKVADGGAAEEGEEGRETLSWGCAVQSVAGLGGNGRQACCHWISATLALMTWVRHFIHRSLSGKINKKRHTIKPN